jgi:hypothetical protein
MDDDSRNHVRHSWCAGYGGIIMKDLIETLGEVIAECEKLPASPHVSNAICALKAARDNLNGAIATQKPPAKTANE